jgi:hypothetical protein
MTKEKRKHYRVTVFGFDSPFNHKKKEFNDESEHIMTISLRHFLS